LSKQEQNSDTSSSSDEESVLYYEPPPDYKEKKAKKALEKEKQKQMFGEMYAAVLEVQKGFSASNKKAAKPSASSMQYKEEINRTPHVHPVRLLFNLL